MRTIASHVVVLCGWTLLPALGLAQYPGAPVGGPFGGGGFNRPPAVSPYLNLNRGGDPAINYYGLVRPQMAYNRAFQNLGNEVNYLESASLNQQLPLQTGHRTSFMTHYQYFMNYGTGGRMGGSGMRGGYQQGMGTGAQQAAQQRTPSSTGR